MHDFFFIPPRACEPGAPEAWPAVTEASHEYQARKRKPEAKAASAPEKKAATPNEGDRKSVV